VATCMSSHIVLFDTGDVNELQPRVLRVFDQHRRTGSGRAVRGRTASVDVDGDGDGDAEVPTKNEVEEDVEEDAHVGIVSRMTISADGQWLASTDDLCRTHVFNLDSMQVGAWFPLVDNILLMNGSSITVIYPRCPNRRKRWHSIRLALISSSSAWRTTRCRCTTSKRDANLTGRGRCQPACQNDLRTSTTRCLASVSTQALLLRKTLLLFNLATLCCGARPGFARCSSMRLLAGVGSPRNGGVTGRPQSPHQLTATSKLSHITDRSSSSTSSVLGNSSSSSGRLSMYSRLFRLPSGSRSMVHHNVINCPCLSLVVHMHIWSITAAIHLEQ
jgi:hypothetical protein